MDFAPATPRFEAKPALLGRLYNGFFGKRALLKLAVVAAWLWVVWQPLTDALAPFTAATGWEASTISVPGRKSIVGAMMFRMTEDPLLGLPGNQSDSSEAAPHKIGKMEGNWARSSITVEDLPQATVVGRHGPLNTVQACVNLCRAQEGCTGWYFCRQANGCRDRQSGANAAYHTCLLLNMPVLPLALPEHNNDTSELSSSYAAGYTKGHLHLRPPFVMVVTPVRVCGELGWHREPDNFMNRLAVASKQDYTRLQGFDFYLESVKPNVTAVDMINTALKEAASRSLIEWVVWLDYTLIVDNPTATFPFAQYIRQGKDLVMWADAKSIAQRSFKGIQQAGMLMRVTPRLQRFWKEVAALLAQPDVMKARLKELAEFHLPNEGINMRNAMMLLFGEQQWLEMLGMEQRYCLSCFFKDHVVQQDDFDPNNGVVDKMQGNLFAHFLGVPACNAFALGAEVAPWLYRHAFIETYKAGRWNFMKAVKQGQAKELAATHVLSTATTQLQAHVLVKGSANLQPSTPACRQSCLATAGCNAWIWCWTVGGCDNGQPHSPSWYPFQGCELHALPQGLPLQMDGNGPAFSSYTVGFIRPKAVAPIEEKEEEGAAPLTRGLTDRLWDFMSGSQPAQNATLLMALAIPPDPCPYPGADHLDVASLANKLDYAHLHGFEVALAASDVDPTMTGQYNKVAFILKLLNETSAEEAGWIWWIDTDTIIPAMATLPRFEAYRGKDLVVWGDNEKLMAGDINGGINTGSLLIRNSDWSRQYWGEVEALIRMGDAANELLAKEMNIILGFGETAFIIYPLKTNLRHHSKLQFEDTIGLNRHWLQVDWQQQENPLVVHYSGCSFCRPPRSKLTDGVSHMCMSEFFKGYAYARCNMEAEYRTIGSPNCTYPASDLSWINIRLGM